MACNSCTPCNIPVEYVKVIGRPGVRGNDGAIGSQGAVGYQGFTGPQGPPGPNGVPGGTVKTHTITHMAAFIEGIEGSFGASFPALPDVGGGIFNPSALYVVNNGAGSPEDIEVFAEPNNEFGFTEGSKFITSKRAIRASVIGQTLVEFEISETNYILSKCRCKMEFRIYAGKIDRSTLLPQDGSRIIARAPFEINGSGGYSSYAVTQNVADINVGDEIFGGFAFIEVSCPGRPDQTSSDDSYLWFDVGSVAGGESWITPGYNITIMGLDKQ